MLEEAMEYLDPKPGETIFDGTLGGASYTLEIAKRVGTTGKVIATDMDETAITNAKLKIDTVEGGIAKIRLYHANFRDIERVLESEFDGAPLARLAGVVLDLGLSSAQLDDRTRGFSFQKDAPLNMSFGADQAAWETEKIVNLSSVQELTKLLRDYGEERYALSIARAIVKQRNEQVITTTKELVEAIGQGVPSAYRRRKIHFATKTFQALRLATNDELGNLKTLLAKIQPFLAVGARIVIVSFHSLEDRIVKQFFKTESRDCLCPPEVPVCVCHHQAWLELLTKKAAQPGPAEIALNPRARSAKLRAARVIN
jgi:16S rRNA (cytosine1402-N4)-methyltransferase